MAVRDAQRRGPEGLLIGTSGWNYDHWKTNFYAGVKRKDRLRHYAGRFNTVEVNATFYRLQQRRTLERWCAETPVGFRFAVKGNRYLTHSKKLKDPSGPVALERQCASPLGARLAAVLWQLPASFTVDVERLRDFVQALDLWKDTRHAVEFRHASWFRDEVSECLRESGVANCLSDAADWSMWDAVTTDLVYVRLHGHTRTYTSSYARRSLEGWARKIRGWRRSGKSVFVYFDNDAAGAAPRDAARLVELTTPGRD